MILQFLIKKQDMSPRLTYVLDFISQSLGYRYKLVHSASKLSATGLVITWLPGGEVETKNSAPGLNIFNSRQISRLDQAELDVNIFEWQKLSIPIVGQRLKNTNSEGWRYYKQDDTYHSSAANIWSTNIDIFTNILYHLSRYEEKWRHFAEETASDHTTSLLSRYHNLKIPVVDILLDYLRYLVGKKSPQTLRILPWPGGEQFGAALSHDVDLTRGVSFKRRLINNTYSLFKKASGAAEVASQLKTDMDEQDAQVWSFPKLSALYQKYNIHATFFFLARMIEGINIRYNIRSGKFKQLLSTLVKEGHEVGLHSSLNAFNRPSRYNQEKQKLTATVKQDVIGLRQHYLRGKFPRLWRIAAKAGFVYDSSLGYNYQAGYRAGTTHPFFAFDYDHDECYDLIEFSLVFFEHNLPAKSGQMEFISELMSQAGKYNGLFVALLHPSNYLSEPNFEVWNELVARLAKENVYIDTLKGHWQWFKMRNQIQITTRAGNIIDIKKPAQLARFSFCIEGASCLVKDKSAHLTEFAPGCFTIESSQSDIRLHITS